MEWIFKAYIFPGCNFGRTIACFLDLTNNCHYICVSFHIKNSRASKNIDFRKIHFHKIKNIDRSLLNRPGVTILKPIKTIDSNELGSLKTNLETFFRLSYTNYEIIFCIPSKEDLSISIIRKLIQANPNVKAKLLIGKIFIYAYISQIYD